MTKVFAAITALIVWANICAQQNHTTFETLSWLEGKWQRTDMNVGQTAFEVWTSGPDNGMTGIGYTMTGTDTTFVEHLRVEEKDDNLYYVAIVSHNASPTYFRILEASADGLIAENPEHDFPKRIEYQREGAKLNAIISAGERAMKFTFKRLE